MVYGTTELPATVIDEIARVVAAELDRVARLVPSSTAAELGRLGLPQSGRGARLLDIGYPILPTPPER